jgi:hypothetical protein
MVGTMDPVRIVYGVDPVSRGTTTRTRIRANRMPAMVHATVCARTLYQVVGFGGR